MKINVKYEETKFDEKESFMMKLTEKYPVFNEEIEKKFEFKIPESINIFDELDKHVLGDLCPLKNIQLDKSILYIQSVQLMECDGECKK